MRELGGALLSWRIDNLPPHPATQAKTPPDAARQPGDSESLIRVPPKGDLLTLAQLEDLLQADERLVYLREIPTLDGWSQPLEVYVDLDHLRAERVVTIRSAGRNGRFEREAYEPGAVAPGDAEDDIVLADEAFVRWPEALLADDRRVKPAP
jgi:hypothetical protein